MKRIVILLPWFGKWPAWTQLFLESCRWNDSIDFVIITDEKNKLDFPPNVRIVETTLEDYLASIGSKLGINIRWTDAYKLCEIRPAFGVIHSDIIRGYDYWGYGDIDVIYGNIRALYTPDVLAYDVISAHGHIACGHFLLVRNDERMNKAFQRVRHWRWLMATKQRKSFDERIFSMLFIDDEARRERGFHRFLAPKLGGALLKEQFSTPLKGLKWIDGSENFPRRWFWKEGRLTTENSGDREFLYLHFTHWASARWAGGDQSVWASVKPLVKVAEPRPTSFMISANGFEPIPTGVTTSSLETA